MVMRNRHEGSGAPHWWDDLPPHMRNRFRRPLVGESRRDTRQASEATETQPPVSHSELIIDLSRFAMVFVLISIVILLYLLVALTYVNG